MFFVSFVSRVACSFCLFACCLFVCLFVLLYVFCLLCFACCFFVPLFVRVLFVRLFVIIQVVLEGATHIAGVTCIGQAVAETRQIGSGNRSFRAGSAQQNRMALILSGSADRSIKIWDPFSHGLKNRCVQVFFIVVFVRGKGVLSSFFLLCVCVWCLCVCKCVCVLE